MARYTYQCYKDDGGCDHVFEIACTIAEYQEKHADKQHTCPNCRKRKPVNRNYQIDGPMYVGDSTPKTLGALADRNTSKISVDEKHHLNKVHNEYKEKAPTKELPDGMTRIKQ